MSSKDIREALYNNEDITIEPDSIASYLRKKGSSGVAGMKPWQTRYFRLQGMLIGII